MGSTMAAVTAAVAASYLGVAGTVIGAAVMSFASTVATDVYTHYLRRTGDKVRQHTASAWHERTAEAGDGAPRRSAQVVASAGALLKALPWAKLGAAAALVFCVSMGGILTYQVIVDQTVADQVTGKSRKRAEPRKPSSKKSRHTPAPYREPATSTPAGASPSSIPSTSPATRTPTPAPTLTPKPTQSVPEPSEPSPPEGTPDVTRQSPAPGQGGPSATPPGTVHVELF
ncbi:hypothetical protein [Nonomuraea jabiensis]|uniref:Uncharacterized protein n=1 Tax=Nonomuraea jabiensis TaxID=882448 RepID=A0A7W9G2L9_9ACTN|nr:hypothetical protein [Nonomuraea jabiensis]MBB5776001.1 hypothetical protein [Nonomuraea jabiensis]